MAMHFAMSKIIPNICLSTPIFETRELSWTAKFTAMHAYYVIYARYTIFNKAE